MRIFTNNITGCSFLHQTMSHCPKILRGIVLVLMILLNNDVIIAQTDNPNLPTDCNNSGKLVCTANDVKIGSAFLAGETPTTPINCVLGQPATAYIYLRVSSDAGRQGLFFSANLKINGEVQPGVISDCFSGTLAKSDDNVIRISEPISFTCGDRFSLTNMYIAYSQNDNQCTQTVRPKYCPGTTSKCRDQVQSGDPDIDIEPPLVIGLSKQEGSCTGNNRSITFTATATGGKAPYIYSIDYENDGIVDATTNTVNTSTTFTHSYASGQSYTASLSVVASGTGQSKTTSISNFFVTPCCSLSATCIANNTVTTVSGCSTSDLPAALTNPSSIFQNITQNPCGALVMTAEDVATGNLCPNGISVTRTYTLFDDLNNNQRLDGGEQSVTCTRYFKIVDDVDPSVTGTLSPISVSGCSVAAAPAAMTTIAQLTAAGLTISDNCNGNLSVSSSDGTPSGTCAKSFTRTYTITDGCNNSTQVSQSITVTDDVAPTFTKPANITIYTNGSCTYNADPSITGDVTNESDNCGGNLQATYSDVTTPATCGYVITRTWSLSDPCGNPAANQVQTITVRDNINPVITISNYIPTLGCSPTQAQINAAFGTAVASDNCDQSVALTSGLSNIAINGCERSQTKTWTAVDDCGNSVTKSKTVTWTIPPTVDCYSVFLDNRTYNAASNSTTFRFRICANNCPNAISYVAFIINNGIRVLNPINGSNYNYPGDPNINYRVVTPVKKNQNGVKYESVGEGLKNGCDVFEFTLSGNQSNLSIKVEVKAGNRTSTVDVNPNCLCTQPVNAALTKTTNYKLIPELQIEALKVTASPNPYHDQVQFRIESPVSGQGVLEVYNLLGQKVQTIFQGHVFAGKTQTVNYTVPHSLRTTLIYQMRVGSYRTTGKLLNGK
ncbi:hypothetical protein [Paracnuella aquatica]|uniref:HYR-like domain-containing protein n=1 Tax=Paracnuella aquatica TaxID=2268757 RepID=UPI000F4E28ED|nr:hypothetical protein [Paracnuella aquatica]RPD47510.1 hypothetical protein DRJ53_11740 [Paracnuella aquatica]